jgi:hypothetical protein
MLFLGIFMVVLLLSETENMNRVLINETLIHKNSNKKKKKKNNNIKTFIYFNLMLNRKNVFLIF